MTRLGSLLLGDHGIDIFQVIVEYVVGAGKPRCHKNSVISIVSLSRTCKIIRQQLQRIKIWKSLYTYINLSYACGNGSSWNKQVIEADDESCDNVEVKDDKWMALRKHSTPIISTYIKYGGSAITHLHLVLRHVDDGALNVIASSCRCLRSVQFTFSSVNGSTFFSTGGLVEFFTSVVPLAYISLSPFMPPEHDLSNYVPVSVLDAIASRAFPLRGLEIAAAPELVGALTNVISMLPSHDSFRALSLALCPYTGCKVSDGIAVATLNFFLPTRLNGSLESVTILSLVNFSNILDSHLNNFATGMPHLMKLELKIFEESSTPTDAGLRALAKRYHNLRVLDVSGRKEITLAGVLAVIASNPKLTELRIPSTRICKTVDTKVHDMLTIATAAHSLRLLGFDTHDRRGNMMYSDQISESQTMRSVLVAFPRVLLVSTLAGLIPYPDSDLTIEVASIIKESKAVINGTNDSPFCRFAQIEYI